MARGKVTLGIKLTAVVGGDAAPPSSFNAAEKATWKERLPFLIAGGRIEPADLLIFAEYCRAVVWRAEIEAVARQNTSARSAAGTEKSHPSFMQWVALNKEVQRMAAELGLGTTARLTVTQKTAAVQGELFPLAPAPAPLGKKDQALVAAATAGQGTEWGSDLDFPSYQGQC